MRRKGKLPGYATMLSSYHRAFGRELRGMIETLPIRPDDRVLDLACGDGAYLGWLDERVGPRGLVVGLDFSVAFLDLARRQVGGPCVTLLEADAHRLPFQEGAFDLIWCAQSLYSLLDPVEALRAMRQSVRPGGVVAVLENDSLHHVLLPWPVEVELAVREAELAAFMAESRRPRKFYVARQLVNAFRQAGLGSCQARTWTTNRQAPLDPESRTFLSEYLRNLRDRAAPRLRSELADRFARLVDPGSEEYLLNDPDLYVTTLDHLVVGRRPEHD